MEIVGALEDALRKHVEVLTIEIGPRTAFRGNSLARAAQYIREVFESAGLEITEQAYDYHGQRVTNLIATPPARVGPPPITSSARTMTRCLPRQVPTTTRAPSP